nr:hypothetical protein [uncultured Campylobacter sp.]
MKKLTRRPKSIAGAEHLAKSFASLAAVILRQSFLSGKKSTKIF